MGKLKQLVQSPNSYFMDVKCPGCLQITTVYSHAQTVVLCSNCNVVLCKPTGGLARLSEGCSFRKNLVSSRTLPVRAKACLWEGLKGSEREAVMWKLMLCSSRHYVI